MLNIFTNHCTSINIFKYSEFDFEFLSSDQICQKPMAQVKLLQISVNRLAYIINEFAMQLTRYGVLHQFSYRR